MALEKKSDIFQWVESVLKNKDIAVNEVILNGTTPKGEGFSGEINFVSVHGTKNGKKTKLDLVIKASVSDQKLREQLPIKLCYENEIFVFCTLLPEFQKFEKEKKLKPFDSMPHCYGSLLLKDQEVLVVENLKSHGFDVHNMFQPMNFHHRKLIVETYGHWHGLSFALRHQKPKMYAKMVSLIGKDLLVKFMKSEQMRGLFEGSAEQTCEFLKERQEHVLLEKFRKKIEKGLANLCNDLFQDAATKDHAVLIHGDAWNNNFIFKYEENDTDKINPTKACLLDFQVATSSNPAFDLSYFLYCCTPTEEMQQIPKFLEIYYRSLTTKVTELGSDCEKVFSFSKLMESWKKYSILGLIMSICALPATIATRENKPDIGDMGADTARKLVESMNPQVKEKLFDRLISIVKQNFEQDI